MVMRCKDISFGCVLQSHQVVFVSYLLKLETRTCHHSYETKKYLVPRCGLNSWNYLSPSFVLRCQSQQYDWLRIWSQTLDFSLFFKVINVIVKSKFWLVLSHQSEQYYWLEIWPKSKFWLKKFWELQPRYIYDISPRLSSHSSRLTECD